MALHLSPLTLKRLYFFKLNKRGYYRLVVFGVLFLCSFFAEFIANDKPLVVYYNDSYYFPVLRFYPETTFGGDFETEASYRDPYIQGLIKKRGWMIWPPIPYSYNTINENLPSPAPSPPTRENWLGTD